MVEDRKGHDRRYSLDDSALRRMGYTPLTSFGEGLRSTVKGTSTTEPGGSR